MPQDVEQFEDAYGATVFDTFADLLESLAICEAPGLAHLNVPVWINYDSPEDAEDNGGVRMLAVGIMQPRKGRTWQKIAPATPEDVHTVRQLLARVWAGRMDTGFERWYWTSDRLAMAAKEKEEISA